jgi:dihydrofolate reductase
MSGSDRLEVIYSVAVSLDGYIASADGGVDWLAPFTKSIDPSEYTAFLDSIDAIPVGSRTYEPALGISGDSFGSTGKPCWVFSKRDLPASGPSVTITSASPEEVVGELSNRGIARAWLMGGTRLASSFRAANLISEYSLGVIPVILGAGIPLFESPGPPARLKLIESKAYPIGKVSLRYRVE